MFWISPDTPPWPISAPVISAGTRRDGRRLITPIAVT